ncbi:fatty-acyl-CoA synthase [Micromonospora viridifaciens]|uniref:Fatty-acyl-CoA synthase n=1 Tax=Micromonospora viridifaciens TaxID=1881 RepID=A0A1C4WTI9_MICVI|nr:AMP-binding protein [Micromonospora viridifaciens]SCE99484.1 fatty-acyl-CoA synthase [Micromonospora viridifaciens]
MSTLAEQSTGALRPWPTTVDYTAFYGVATVPEALARSATTGRGIFLLDADLEEYRLTYAELDARARQVAHALRGHGVAPGDRVCLLSSTDLPMVLALFGTWYAGAVPVILPLPGRRQDLDRYAADVRGRLATVDGRLLLVTDPFAEMIATALAAATTPEDTAPVVLPLGAVTAAGPAYTGPPPGDPAALALLQFTSGTTGPSKAVAITHRHILGNMAAIWSSYGVGPDDPGMLWLPLNHDMGVIGLVAVLARGADLVLMAPEHFLSSPMSWLRAMSRYRVAITTAPNFAYALAGRLLRRSTYELDLSHLRWAINGAEPIDPASLDAFTSAGERYGLSPNVACPMYGMAEATLAITMRPPNSPLAVQWVDGDDLTRHGRATPVQPTAPNARRLVACGYPLPGTDIAVRDEHGADLPAGAVGEIHVRGAGVMQGYWRDPAATAEAIVDGWLRTGDLGYVSPDGLVICGRRKDMIILNGRNLYPEEFEVEAERQPGVRVGNTIAFMLPGTEHMVLVAETNKGADHAPTLAADLLTHLRRNLPVPPTEVVVCPPTTIPKTTSGKRQRGLCRELYLSGRLRVLASAGRPAATASGRTD